MILFFTMRIVPLERIFEKIPFDEHVTTLKTSMGQKVIENGLKLFMSRKPVYIIIMVYIIIKIQREQKT